MNKQYKATYKEKTTTLWVAVLVMLICYLVLIQLNITVLLGL